MTTGRTILFLDQFPEIGGGQRILLDLVAAAPAHGHRACVLCPSGPLLEEARGRGAEVHALEIPPLRSGGKTLREYVGMFFISRARAMEWQPLMERCDLVVVNGPRTLGIARHFVSRLRKPAVVMLHNIYVRFQAWLIRRFLRLPRTAAVAPSPFVAAPFHDSPSVHVISDWVSPEFLAAPASPAALRRALAIGDSSPIILIPGRFSPKKGQLLALEASRLLADLPCHVVFSGAPLFEEEGKGVEATLREAARLQPQRIHVIPWREPLPSLYDGADIVLIPSVWEEPFGLVALEAMARERPLIVSNRGMLPELVGGGQFADIVPPAAGAIAAALRNFLQDRPRWMERARRAREHVRSTFNPTVLQGQIFGLFQQLISV